MPLSQNQQDELKQAVSQYLKSLILIHVWDQPRSNISIDYQQHCLMNVFASSEKAGPHGLFGPIKAWETCLETVGGITGTRIQRGFLGNAIDNLYQQVNGLPLSDAELEVFVAQIVEQCNQIYDQWVTAYVPLVNIELHDVDELSLADIVLYRGKTDSDFATHLSDLPADLNFNVPLESPFFKITVGGDDENIKDEVAAKTADALRALRFVCWTNSTIKGTKRISYNEARDVAPYPNNTLAGHFIFVNSSGKVFNRYQTNRTSPSILRITKDKLDQFNLFGLADINSHFANDTHPISAHILLALQWYDSGLQAIRDRDALYRFIVCVNGILSWDDSKAIHRSQDLYTRYSKLLNTSLVIETDRAELDFLGALSTQFTKLNTGISLQDAMKIIAADHAQVCKNLYEKHRNYIVHGYSNPTQPLTDIDIHNSRLLAQNAIRLTMKLIAKHPQWTVRKDIEDWFAAP